MDVVIQEVAYHRNGSSGEGFHAILFKDGGRRFVATVFGYNPKCHRDEGEGTFRDPVYRDPHVAVLDVGLLADTVGFGFNSWRGDRYSADLYDAIDYYWENK